MKFTEEQAKRWIAHANGDHALTADLAHKRLCAAFNQLLSNNQPVPEALRLYMGTPRQRAANRPADSNKYLQKWTIGRMVEEKLEAGMKYEAALSEIREQFYPSTRNPIQKSRADRQRNELEKKKAERRVKSAHEMYMKENRDSRAPRRGRKAKAATS